ncbi:MAG: hypothetical protein IE933_03380 [Sphingomonadales bacterium]|nr:hypothetical protein [Sphingomonadales bacterium]MBD3772082.1 hypothetical protein [Paracoccaceae bacterium]
MSASSKRLTGSSPVPPPCEGPKIGRFASKEHYEWLAAESMRLMALFGIEKSDATAIARQFRGYPEQRRADDLVRHAALTLRARQRFLSRGRKMKGLAA